jgi:hypothetical protein
MKINDAPILNTTPFYLFSFYNREWQYKILPIYFNNAAVTPGTIFLPQDNTLSKAKIYGLSVVNNLLNLDLDQYTNDNNNTTYTVMNAANAAGFTLNLVDFNNSYVLKDYPVNALKSGSPYRGGKTLATCFNFSTNNSFLRKTSATPLSSNFQVLILEFLYKL